MWSIQLLQVELNDQCRQHSKKFFAAQSIGLSGFIFADLIEHDFVMCAQPCLARTALRTRFAASAWIGLQRQRMARTGKSSLSGISLLCHFRR
jgi:hypothetical protein